MNRDTIILPIVHLNGTSRQALLKQRIDAARALNKALDAFYEMGPNGRDYYPQPGLMDKAQAQHQRRLAVLNDLLEEIEYEVRALGEEG